MTARHIGCAILTAIIVCAGCDGLEEPPPEESRDAGPRGTELIGSFSVTLLAPSDSDPEGHTSLIGKVYDGPSPSQLVWEESMRDGDCQLLTPRAPFCPQACGGEAVCVEDGVCQSYPTAQNVGTVRVKGLKTRSGDREFAMEPIANAYQPNASIKLPFPAFSEGDDVQLKATGGDLEAFTLEAKGIAPLSVPVQALKLESGAPLAVTWTKPKTQRDSRVRMKLDISHHGGSKGMISCDSDDTGEAQLSAAMVTQLLELGVAGYPSLIVSRESAGGVSIQPGRVELMVVSKEERFVEIEGLRSCTGDGDCGFGQTCQADLTCL
ncbi:MAG TPA: hypothetical protein VFG30_24685 [Polyangiales bacterium]|nr:hypothetical protein [Polyangiales bacterium]